MSFTTETKQELINHYTKAAHCRNAELIGMMLTGAHISENEGKKSVHLDFENEESALKIKKQLLKCFGTDCILITDERPRRKTKYVLQTEDLKALEDVAEIKEKEKLDEILKRLKMACCKRAALRGMFIEGGTISNPEKNYHFEIADSGREVCEFACELMKAFGINAKVTKRKDKFIAYVKEAEEISEILNVMEAHNSMMNFENVRILREVRGNVNRKVNCETANINKTVNAGMKQIENIRLIEEKIGLDSLDENLQAIAKARLLNPDVSLVELGEMLTPPVGKSGVNHRMRKLNQIALKLREGSA